MQLSDKSLNDYIDTVLFFGPDEKKAYESQIDHLKTTLTSAIHQNSDLGVISINQAGSWRKGTALKPGAAQDIDIDLIVYLDVEEAGANDINLLHDRIVTLLQKAYPTKKKDDFNPGKKTVNIEFHTRSV
ncbi:hypothetical protein HUW63_35685 [Myxococcus sp. AM001]|nr:hypothetical protein [Myxococcus sp. AM001]